MIEFKNVSASYDGELAVLADVSLSLIHIYGGLCYHERHARAAAL